MKVMVAFASKHGSTEEIAARIQRTLTEHGLEADLARVDDVALLDSYDAVVLGSAVYMDEWLPDARAFVDAHRHELSDRMTWLFSSGPLGSPPKPTPDANPKIDALLAETGAREHRFFLGKLDKDRLGLGARAVVRVVQAPYGDFRDWAAITAWAADIADILQSRASSRGTPSDVSAS